MEHALRAVDYLHSQKVLHLDLKPENFIAVGDTIKLIDFAGSYSFKSTNYQHTKVYVTTLFLAPGM
jgi:serine/threonine protein kinase